MSAEDAPPGTVPESFLQRSATQAAIVATVGFAMMLAKGLIMGSPISREALAVGLEGNVWAWLAAVGIHSVGQGGLRAK
jgi:hypothetical protein